MQIHPLVTVKKASNVLGLDKAIIRYGQGYFFKPTGDTIEETLESIKNRKEIYKAVLKILGKNGLIKIQQSNT